MCKVAIDVSLHNTFSSFAVKQVVTHEQLIENGAQAKNISLVRVARASKNLGGHEPGRTTFSSQGLIVWREGRKAEVGHADFKVRPVLHPRDENVFHFYISVHYLFMLEEI